MKYISISKDDPRLRIPKSRLGMWFYLYGSSMGYISCVGQVMLIALNLYLGILYVIPVLIILFIICFISGRRITKFYRKRIQTIKDIISLNDPQRNGAHA
jgi:hypothetical protein